MNTILFSEAMGHLNDAYIDEALSYQKVPAVKPRTNPKRLVLLLAAAIAVLALCGFTAYELGLFDPWLQEPNTDPVLTVKSAVEEQAGKEYTLNVRFEHGEVDESETERVAAMYRGSELAEARGWTDECLDEHFVAVFARYYVEYDHTKTFMFDGYTEQYFYLIQDEKTGAWTIVENTSPNTHQAP